MQPAMIEDGLARNPVQHANFSNSAQLMTQYCTSMYLQPYEYMYICSDFYMINKLHEKIY